MFDLDGTLVHSAPDLHAAANHMLSGLGRAALSEATVTSFIGHGVAKLVERCLEETGGIEGVFERALADFRNYYDANPTALTTLYPGVDDTLDRLEDLGLAVGVCTNKPEAPARAILDLLGLSDRVRTVIGGDTTGALKPSAAPLLAAIRGIGATPANAVYVGDSETDEAAAAAARVPFVLFTGGYRNKPVRRFQSIFAFDAFDEFIDFVVLNTRDDHELER